MENRKKILIVEDEELLSEFLKIRLNDDGYEVAGIADTGERAVTLAREKLPDLVICDIMLAGGMNGVEVAKQIRSFSETPFIYSSSNIVQEAIESNPYGYLLKPINYDELKIAIELALYRFDLEKQLTSYHAHLSQAQLLGNVGSWEWDITTNQIHWTDQIYRIFGLKPREFAPTYPAFLERIHPDDRQSVISAVDNAVKNKKVYDIEHRIVTPSGKIRYVHEIGDVTFDKDNNPLRMIGTVIDVSERKLVDDRIKHLAYYDALTNLPNRTLLMDRLDVLMATSKRNSEKFAVLFIDLDGFKNVNDLYGHKMGDKVLNTIAERFEKITRDMDTIARIGGDEFIALINETQSSNAVKIVSEKILSEINKPINLLTGVTINISASIGVAMFPDDGSSADELLTKSDNAMYAAKNAGKNQLCFHSEV